MKKKIIKIENIGLEALTDLEARQTEKTITEILTKLYTIPCSFPMRESEEYDAGFQDALRECRYILKSYLLKK